MFIADLRQRRVHEDNPKYKPGRQVVTFLLITNLALWITYNFEIQKVNSHTQGDQFYPDNLCEYYAYMTILWINVMTHYLILIQVNVTPDQSEFYGYFPWAVIQRITLPLCVFFRFHSTVVLAELWKNCYQIRKHKNADS